ncbi:hypothetical protein EVA_06273 [gut metagenome]|uniref:Uncharacterized protein n=1 Tax=gut metagenome TaxID=749906 RepID=J9GE56_9ZZZZ
MPFVIFIIVYKLGIFLLTQFDSIFHRCGFRILKGIFHCCCNIFLRFVATGQEAKGQHTGQNHSFHHKLHHSSVNSATKISIPNVSKINAAKQNAKFQLKNVRISILLSDA